jgi:hypothetical protein
LKGFGGDFLLPGFDEKVDRLYREDHVSQAHYLSVLGEEVRMISLEVLMKYRCFFVPNDDYLRFWWGESCRNPEYELYDYDGRCVVNNCIVVPCRLLNGSVVGWTAFNPFIKYGEGEGSYYFNPSEYLFKRGNYLFCHPDVFKSALSDGYIIVTDGVFDCLSLTGCGLNSCSVLGSSVNARSVFCLKFVDKVYVSIDNDEAGLRLLSGVRRFIPNARFIKQGREKDVDDLLKTEVRDRFVREVLMCVGSGVDVSFRV